MLRLSEHERKGLPRKLNNQCHFVTPTRMLRERQHDIGFLTCTAKG